VNGRLGPADRFRQRSMGKLDEISYGELWRFVFKTVSIRFELDTLAQVQVSLPVFIPAMCHTHPRGTKCSTIHHVTRTSLLYSSVRLLFDFSAYISALKTEAVRSSETYVNFYQTTWHYVPEDINHKS
jgi:hypothetical protein